MVIAAHWPWIAAGVACALVLAADLLHARRASRIGRLLFGPSGRPRRWTLAAPVLRALACAALAWGVLTLLRVKPEESGPKSPEKQPIRHHLIVALDVSPSMDLKDAGPEGGQTRMERCAKVLGSILDRLELETTRVSVIAFYTGWKPVVVDTFDPEVIRNILEDLPLTHAFPAGKTNLYEGVRGAAEIAKAWPPDTATLLVVSDGDTLPDSALPVLPPSIGGVLVVGVGDIAKGLFIDGHVSRQNAPSLERLAARFAGHYHDGNRQHVPTKVLRDLSETLPPLKDEELGDREYALIALGCGAALLALLGPLLACFGSGFSPFRVSSSRRASRPADRSPAEPPRAPQLAGAPSEGVLR
ncbi:MAG: VWA domain-containing protein [Planctomycetes bacterium]|nr:VWA domain-containing protein [Planctomycetota bacterium]